MTTEAGQRLLAEEWDNFDAKPWGSLADHVAAIEAEARAALLAGLESGVEGLDEARVHRYEEYMDAGWDEAIAAVLDLIRKAGEK